MWRRRLSRCRWAPEDWSRTARPGSTGTTHQLCASPMASPSRQAGRRLDEAVMASVLPCTAPARTPGRPHPHGQPSSKVSHVRRWPHDGRANHVPARSDRAYFPYYHSYFNCILPCCYYYCLPAGLDDRAAQGRERAPRSPADDSFSIVSRQPASQPHRYRRRPSTIGPLGWLPVTGVQLTSPRRGIKGNPPSRARVCIFSLIPGKKPAGPRFAAKSWCRPRRVCFRDAGRPPRPK